VQRAAITRELDYMRRCVIYTRQSPVPYQHETSCNAQFERCSAYLKSQAVMGGGGSSGDSMIPAIAAQLWIDPRSSN